VCRRGWSAARGRIRKDRGDDSNKAACNEAGVEQSNDRCVSFLSPYGYAFKLVCYVVVDAEDE